MSDIIFEETEAIFTIKTTGEATGESFSGKFRVKTLLSPLNHIKADKLMRQLLGDHSLVADELSRQYAFMLSQLQFRVISSPLWWKSNLEVEGGHIEDKNVLIEILNKALEAEEIYRSNQKKIFDDNIEKLTKKFPDLANAEMEEADEN
jgi:hypothetical protein